jgi:hypothetical protein
VVPVLVRCLSDKDKFVTRAVIRALSTRAKYAQPLPNLVVPALTNFLQGTTEELEGVLAMEAIGNYGPKAKLAAAALLPYTTNSDKVLREKATETITKIASDALTSSAAP